MKITDLQIVKNAMTAFGFTEAITASAAKKEIKQKIENGSVKIEALNEEQANDMIKYLADLKTQATEQKETLTVDQMVDNKKELGKVATIFDQIAISNYNFATAELNADKKRVKEVAKAITELSSIYDTEIKAVEEREKAERMEFARNWFAEEIVRFDVYEFAADWNLYASDKLETKGAYNYTKTGMLSSLKKDQKELIMDKLSKFQTEKQVIETNEYAATLLEFYIKSDYNITSALIKLEDFKRLKLEEEERAKAKAEAEQAERERIQKQIAAEEAAKKIEAENKAEELEEGTELKWDDDVNAPDAEMQTHSPDRDPIQELERLIWLEEMSDRPNRGQIKQWRKEIAQLTVSNIEHKEAEAQKTFNTLVLRTAETPVTKLGNLLVDAGVEVKNVYVNYEVTIEATRLDGFKKWLNENSIEIVEVR